MSLPIESLTQTIVNLPAGVSTQLVTANPSRKYLAWMVVGTNPATIVPGSAEAVAGQGMSFNGASALGNQGGYYEFDTDVMPDVAFQAISTAGTSICVWEG
jgi:hypothetical protein